MSVFSKLWPTWIVLALLAPCGSPASAQEGGGRVRAFQESAREFTLGLAVQRRGEHGEAEAHYRRALELDENFVEAMVNLARVHVARGDGAAAEVLLARAQSIRPDYPETYAVRGLAQLQGGDFAAAAAQLSLALDLDPRNLESLVNLGAAWIGTGRPEQAREPLEQAVRIDPMAANAILNLAIAEERSGRAAQAAFWYARFLELVRADDPIADAVRVRERRFSLNDPLEEERPLDADLGSTHQQLRSKEE